MASDIMGKQKKRQVGQRRLKKKAKRKTRRTGRSGGAAAQERPPWLLLTGDESSVTDLAVGRPEAPYELQLAAEAARELAGARPSIAGIAALETEAIVARLAELGIEVERAGFETAARAREDRSGWQLALGTLLSGPSQLAPLERDFAALAACELWRRWLPDEPSREQLQQLCHQVLTMADDALPAAIEAWELIESIAPDDPFALDLGLPITPAELLEELAIAAQAAADRLPDDARRATELLDRVRSERD